MKTFKVYKHPVKGLEVVKVGFSWPAFLFSALWMLLKRMWGIAILWIVLSWVLNAIGFAVQMALENSASVGDLTMAPFLVSLAYLAVYFAISLVPGFKGNQWREENLVNRGYDLVGTAQTATPDAAIAQVVKPG